MPEEMPTSFTLAPVYATEMRMDSAPVDLRGVVDGAAATWGHRCAAAGVDFRVEGLDAPIVVFGDAQRLRQALDGLLENALRVTPQGAPIVVATHTEPGGMAVLEVRDGGPGLTDDDLPVAFERSALYERYRGVRQVGTGLGLAIVHRIVERLGGTVEAGHAPEGGARFTIRMPVLTPETPVPQLLTRTEP